MNPISTSTTLLVYLISIVVPIWTTDFSSSTQKFANNIYDILRRSGDNVFFSPISVHAVLSMAYQGAAGGTAAIMQNTLSLPEANVTASNYRDILTSINDVKDVQLYMANKIYIEKTEKLLSNFQSKMNNFFMADAENIDFKENNHVVDEINKWAATNTKNKINKIFSADDINGDTKLILLNAIYFKGNWLHFFNPNDTTLEKFYTSDAAAVDCKMMHIIDEYFYDNNRKLDAQILNMPYVNNRTNFIIILPNSKTGIKQLEEKLVHMDLDALTEHMYQTKVILSLPKFKIETTIDLTNTLREMGLETIFSEQAEFSKMIDSPDRLGIDKILQKAFIVVNEEGSEASVVTFSPVSSAPAMPQNKISMNVDHPFIVIITFRKGEELYPIFMGKIMQP